MGERAYRVEVHTCGAVDVICFDYDPLGDGAEGRYADAADLPAWMRDRLTVLQVLAPPPPPSDVPGVGRRLLRDADGEVFWIYRGDTDGNHTGG